MIKDILVRLAAHWAEHGSLHSVLVQDELPLIRQEEAYRAALEAISRNTYSQEESGGIYADERVLSIAEAQGWTASIATHAASTAHIYSSPFPSMFCMIEGNGLYEVDLFSSRNLLTNDITMARTLTLSRTGQLSLGRDQITTFAPDRQLFHLKKMRDSQVFLRFTGPFLGPFIHAFDKDSLTYSYSSYSTTEHTGHAFLSRLIKEVSIRGLFNGEAREAERAKLVALIETLSNSPTLTPSAEWLLLQAMSQVSPSAARSKLLRLAEASGPLLAQARRALETIES
ncbi:MAG: hypothetical protein PSY12_12005 [bacterium]|nr:hypothetical protein [bacterium]